MTLCLKCFPYNIQNPNNILQEIVSTHDLFWVGYLCCDYIPEGAARQSKYDLYLSELNNMNFHDTKVLYNHNKKRRSLGKIKLTWHNHNFKPTGFAIGFLAVIHRSHLTDIPLCVTGMGGTFASLSTLESDRSSVVELSLTYCGARNGCTGVIVSNTHVNDIVKKYGFPKYYKWGMRGEINASVVDFKMDGAKEESPLTTEEILRTLPKEQYQILIEKINKDNSTLEQVISKYDESEKKNNNLNELLGHYTDCLFSMIQTRLMLEQNSDSVVASKRREGFEELKKMGILEKDCSDLQASMQLINYCKDAFKDSPEYEYVEKFWSSFKNKFPDLHDQLPEDKSMVTVDAALNLVSQQLRDNELNSVKNKSTILNKRALQVAANSYDSIENQRRKQRVTNQETSKVNKNDMSCREFLKSFGFEEDSSSENERSAPPQKRTKKDNEVDPEFLEFALKKEKERHILKKRYETHKKTYEMMKKKELAEKEEKLDALIKCIPRISKFADFLEHQMSDSDMKDKEGKVPVQSDEGRIEASLKPEKDTDESSWKL